MILLELFIGFLKVGCFAFGGAYGAIPLIRDVVLSYGWLDDEMLTYMIAVSESTPGPIMVNLATGVYMILRNGIVIQNSSFTDPVADPDPRPWSSILRLQKDKKGRHFPDSSDLYLCCRRDCCSRIIRAQC